MNIIDRLFGTKKQQKPGMTRLQVPDQPEAEPMAPTPSPASQEQYVKDCLRQKYDERPETRSWNSEAVFQKVLDPLNSGDNATACREAERLISQFSDFADLYDWWGDALLRMGSIDKARQVLRDGLDKARQKFPLCTRLGVLEFKAHDLAQAVYWWAQGLHCQESLQASHYGDYTGAYLYLHYVAEGLQLPECSRAFLMRVDSIRREGIRLDATTANALITMARSSATPSIAEVLNQLADHYIISCKPSATKADPNEFDTLVRQLKELESQGWNADKEKAVRAIERLGEIGDPRGIGVIMSLRGLLIMVDVAVPAEKVIRELQNADRGNESAE